MNIKYNDEVHPILVREYLKLGWSFIKIAKHFGVATKRLNEWKKTHPKFKEAISFDDRPIDNSVEMALIKLATGFEYTEEGTEETVGKIGITSKEIQRTKIYPPNITAIMFWLKNRDPDSWKELSNIEMAATVSPQLEEKMKKVSTKDLKAIALAKIQQGSKN